MSPLRRFVLSGFLWLPLCFFAWFYFAGPLVFPAFCIVRWAVAHFLPDAISAASLVFDSKLHTVVINFVPLLGPQIDPASGRTFVVDAIPINPMVYGYALPLFYLLWSLRYGEIAGDNPWNAAGLEWKTTSPPPTFNFHEDPVVDFEAYNYDELKDIPDER